MADLQKCYNSFKTPCVYITYHIKHKTYHRIDCVQNLDAEKKGKNAKRPRGEITSKQPNRIRGLDNYIHLEFECLRNTLDMYGKKHGLDIT